MDRVKALSCRLGLVAVLLWGLNLSLAGLAVAAPNFSSAGFQAKWERADKAVAEGAANPPRSWLWGPEGWSPPGGPAEPYAESPGGARQVQYFDKARMELNNPATGLVTNGLLVVELISGRLATGDSRFVQRYPASDLPIAGDPANNPGPTYGSFGRVASLDNTNPAPNRVDQSVADTLDRAGRVATSADLGRLAHYGYYEPTLKHNIPDVFWAFLNQRGNVYQAGQYQPNQTVLGDNPAAPWLDAVGYPLSEAYWARVAVGGQVKDVLIQAFQRRVLTYTPGNPAAFQVEMGNVGRHYFAWRYNSKYDLPAHPPLGGVNLAGAEFTPGALPGNYGVEYAYPSHAEVDYFRSKGLNTFRVPFLWERLQPARGGELDGGQLARLDDVVNYATSKGATVILDAHNYARYYGKTLGPADYAAFASLWSRLAAHYKDNPKVAFGLMNEPINIGVDIWVGAANAAIQAIRGAGMSNLVLVAGSNETAHYSWNQVWSGTPYGQAMLNINDPASNYAYEYHLYLDADSSGTSERCVSPTIGAERLRDFTNWLRQNNQRGFLGEFGAGRNPTCYAALDNLLTQLDQNTLVWLGWTYWAAGPLWGDYSYSLEPTAAGDRPQLATLLRHLG